MATFHLKVLTAEKLFYEGEVQRCVVLVASGDIGILPRHTPYVAPLGIGGLTVTNAAGNRRMAAVSGGFVEVGPEATTIIARTCEWADEIDLNRAQAAYESGRQPQIMKQANTFLSAMTRGKYALRISEDGKDIGIVDSEHRVKEAKIWSSGTGDQVFLAIRLAMALSFGEQLEPLPIVLDDIFVRFDDPDKGFLVQGMPAKIIYPFQLSRSRYFTFKTGGREE